MNAEQKKFAFRVLNELTFVPTQLKQTMQQELDTRLSAVDRPARLGALEITPADLQELAGDEVWAQIQTQVAAIKNFVNS